MKRANLTLLMLFRYVDDLRIMLRPICKGWFWEKSGWIFDPDRDDERDLPTRTVEEIGKSLNSVWEFLEFTTESQRDFTDNFLPTLDFATSVQPNVYVLYKFFSKPMASNLLLSFGTALSKSCVFSS